MSDYNDGILPEPCLRMDTHFGDEYESVEFGDGTGYIKAAPILAKVGALHEEIDRLQDENAELRRELELDEPLFETLNAANDALLAENAELRELVRKVEHYEQLGCHDCPHGGSCAVDTLYDEGCAMSREIEFEKRKLGIEVDA